MRKNVLEYDDVMSEQRKTVYKIRQQLLLGTYTPEYLDDTGKPTGKNRDIKTLPRLKDDVEGAIRDMLLHYGTPLPGQGGEANGEELKKPEKIDDLKELYAMESLRADLYQYWGYRFDYKESELKKPKEVYERLLAEIPQSLSEQRERLLDLIDGIVGAMVEESCPLGKPPEDWDWKGLKEGFVEHFSTKPVDYENTVDHDDLAHILYTQAVKELEVREKEMGTELMLRVFRHYYLEEIDRAWVEHLTNMEHLRDGIGLVGYGQKDPKQEYKKQGYDIFLNMMASSSSNVCSKVFSVQVKKENDIERMEREDLERHNRVAQAMQMRHGSDVEGGEPETAKGTPSRRPPAPQPKSASAQPVRRDAPKVGRNDLCPCGSGEKFKKCHGAALEEEGSDDASA
jgi:preprotein translocase subunit SecA